MTTLVLSAAGAALGATLNSSFLGVTSAQFGRLAGATLGRYLEGRGSDEGTKTAPAVTTAGSEPVTTGKIDHIRANGLAEGAPIAVVFGRARLAGQIIWASNFRESIDAGRSGHGSARLSYRGESDTIEGQINPIYSHRYSVSLAIALCEGPIASVDRIWADGVLLPTDQIRFEVYHGGEDQQPDPTMEAIEGTGQVPAYRGIAYVVFDDLDLTPFGNRVPNFSFEVSRIAPEGQREKGIGDLARDIRAVALMPGSGEFALATTPVRLASGETITGLANQNSATGLSDLDTSLDQLTSLAPNLEAASLIVSWFGDDLRAGHCQLKPKVERRDHAGAPWDWQVAGLDRANAEQVTLTEDGRPIYGGTPADQSVVEAIGALNERGIAVMFYPFILMEQVEGNSLPDPYTGLAGQPVLPWRGRITTALAPGMEGTTDRSSAAAEEVAAFFGTAQPDDWQLVGESLIYSGPAEFGLRRMILHYAWLCRQAGGVESFCIGSEMRGLTQIRGAGDSFPAVEALRQLAADVRAILGEHVKIGYAADWSEYFGYAPAGENNRYFHLDPLWADENIDFIGIDNYMPLSDWREGPDHRDAEAADSLYALDYLTANVAGGEGYDWYYASSADRRHQIRTPIADGAHHEPWIWRYKDLYNWWHSAHFERIDGVRQPHPTAWEPQSKPFWFTELGCAAIDKGTNQPNKFLDPKSSESALPYFSTAARDDLIQMRYYQAMASYWENPANNPSGTNPYGRPPEQNPYLGPMVETGRGFAWAWDARPYPYFPRLLDLWSDGDNYDRGHWLNGRLSSRSLASVVAEICERAGCWEYDVSQLWGVVRGYVVDFAGSARAMLQPLAQRHGFDVFESAGKLVFRMRDGRIDHDLTGLALAEADEVPSGVQTMRGAAPEREGRLRLSYIETDGEYGVGFQEAIFSDEESHAVAQMEAPLAMTASEARQVLERWLAEARIGTERLQAALPPSLGHVQPGDVIGLGTAPGQRWRVERAEGDLVRIVDAVRVSETPHSPADLPIDEAPIQRFYPPLPVSALFMDLPYLNLGGESEISPWIAMGAEPWPGTVLVQDSATGEEYVNNSIIAAAAITGRLARDMPRAPTARIDRHGEIHVELDRGALSNVSQTAFLNGANLAAIGHGSGEGWEIVQFQQAALGEDGLWRLRHILRGQFGSDADMPDIWPQGSRFVLLDGLVRQLRFSANQIDRPSYWRWGPADAPLDDPAFQTRNMLFRGVGLRPLRPVHLTARWRGADLDISWMRRTRKGGDNWDAEDVPIGETALQFRLQVLSENGDVVHSVTLAPPVDPDIRPSWTLSASLRASLGLGTSFAVQVAQYSFDLGRPGPFAVLPVHTGEIMAV